MSKEKQIGKDRAFRLIELAREKHGKHFQVTAFCKEVAEISGYHVDTVYRFINTPQGKARQTSLDILTAIFLNLDMKDEADVLNRIRTVPMGKAESVATGLE